MKKCVSALFVVLLCLVLCLSGNVNAAALHFNEISASQILGINTFRMNMPDNITLDESSITTFKATPKTDYPKYNDKGEETGHPGDGSFKGAGAFPYWMFTLTDSDAYISAVWNDVGWYNDGKGEKEINAVMTLSNFHTIEDSNIGTTATVGICKKAMAWILLSPNGLYSDVQLYFYYKDDATKQPIDMGDAYIGVGGQNSEKRIFNGDQNKNNELASKYIHTLSAPRDNGPEHAGIQGRQWEWVSYDNYLKNDTLQVYGLREDTETGRKCVLHYIERNQMVYPKDYDVNYGPYSYCATDWGVGSQNCTFDLTGGMINPTGFNVITNAGDRHDSWIDGDINNFTGAFKYANSANDQVMYMVQMGTVKDYSEIENIKGTKGRIDGKPFSIYNFTSGKDIGSVELGLAPMALATEVKKPGKIVDKTVAHEQENIKYTITQQIGNMNDRNKRIDQRTKYTGLEVFDPLPKEVDFISAVAKNENGNVIAQFSNGRQTSGAENCVINYNSANHTVTYTFTGNYLNNSMRYVGETYTFEINTKITDLHNSDENDYIASNKATTYFSTPGTSRYPAKTEEVHTQIIYDILTKSINASISEMITEILGGEDNKQVIFTPDLGYYVETVEWQTQSNRYAETTPELVNVTEIPNNNKITIPEEKDGTENTYKHVTTITGENPNLPSGNQQTNITEEEKNTLNYDPFAKTIFTYNDVDNNHYVKVVAKPMQMVIQVSKEDVVTGKETQGDAKFVNAQYTVYTDYNEATGVLSNPVDVITLDAEGNGSSKELPLEKADANGPYGEYFVKETKAPEGYLLDENVYRIYKTAVQQTIDREKISYHPITSKEEVWKGRVQLIKFENILGTTEERPATGAILRLTLDSSNGQVYYDVTIDEKGYGEFVGDVLKDYYPYTIPYGQYTITEIKESDLGFHTYFYIQPEKVDLRKKHEQLEYRIFGEEPIEAYLKVQKTDKHTGATVEIAGAKYKIWDVQNHKWVSQMTYPSGVYIDEFETNDEGYFITPQKLLAGDYVIYETKAPKGYYLNDEYRVPEKESDLGDATKGGVAVRIDSVAMGLVTGNQLVYDPDAELVYEQEIANDPLKVKLEINKTGEMLSEVLMSDTKYGEKYTPKYAMQGLPGVTYEIYSVNDIKSPDGRNAYVAKGTKVDTITTDENGIATTVELFPGEYEIREVVTPKGYITDKNIPNVTLTNTDTFKRVETHKKELTNVRQKLELTFEKDYEEVNYANGETLEKKAVFGVYTNQAVVNNKGNIVIPQGKLVDVIEVEGDNANVTSTIDLPEGEYYVQELETSYPYSVNDEKRYFTLEYTNNDDEFVVIEGKKFVNKPEIVSKVSLIKLSTSTFKNVVINGENVEVADIDEQVKELINQFKGMTEDEIKDYLDANNMKYIKNATYKIYLDKECTKPLYIKSGDAFVEAEMITDELGMIKLENIPLGKYYIKETKAPKGYDVSKEVVELELTIEDKDIVVYKILREIIPLGELLEKIDIHTKDPVQGCEFEIYDEEGTVSVRSITNEKGIAYIPEDVLKEGKIYYFKEIKVPEPYTINPEIFEFVAEFDEEYNELKTIKVEVENTRKTIDFVKIIKRDSKTSKPLQGCVFTIVLLDKDGNEYVNKDGEKVYLVENAITDENGEYVIENVPYGTYKFVEMVAPEGYEIDENMTGLTFVANDDSKDGIIFEVTNTGDIQVIVLSIMAIVSLIGIVTIVRKKISLLE